MQGVDGQFYPIAIGPIKGFNLISDSEDSAVYDGRFKRGRQRIIISINDGKKISGLLFRPYTDHGSPGKMERNLTERSLPVWGEWFTVWGVDNNGQNYRLVERLNVIHLIFRLSEKETKPIGAVVTETRIIT